MNNKIFDLDAGTVNVNAVKMLVLANLYGTPVENKQALQERVNDAVVECFKVEAVGFVSEKLLMYWNEIELDAYFGMDELHAMQSGLVNEIEGYAKTYNLSIYKPNIDGYWLNCALIHAMAALCDSIDLSEGDSHQQLNSTHKDYYPDSVMYNLNINIEFGGDNWCIETINGKGGAECFRHINGVAACSNENTIEGKLSQAIAILAYSKAFKKMEDDITDKLMGDETLASKATEIYEVMGGVSE